jgi:hypothetical protein
MAGATGLEPATSAVTGQRSNQLSYAPAGVERDLNAGPRQVKEAWRRFRLTACPGLAADLTAAGISPNAFPIVAVCAVDREAGLVAGAVGHGEAFFTADAGTDVGLAADVPGDPERLAGALHGDRSAVAASPARIAADHAVRAGRIAGEGGRIIEEHDDGQNGRKDQFAQHDVAPEKVFEQAKRGGR